MRVTHAIRVLQILEASCNASRFADTIENAILAKSSGIAYRVAFWSNNKLGKLFVDSRERWTGSVSAIHL